MSNEATDVSSDAGLKELDRLREEIAGLRADVVQLKRAVDARTMLSVAPSDSIFLNVNNVLLRFPASEYRHALSYAQNPAFENWVRNALIQTLGEGMCFLDVGANLGTVAAFAAQRVGAAGKLMAVEPISELEPLIRENVRLNNPFCALEIRIALASDAQGEGVLRIDRFDSRSSSVFELDPSRPIEVRPCPSVRLDDVLPQGWRPDVIKIDVEGSELMALRGLQRTIATAGAIRIILEWVPRYFEAAGYTWQDVVEFADAMGLAIQTVHPLYGAFLATTTEQLAGFEGNVILSKV